MAEGGTTDNNELQTTEETEETVINEEKSDFQRKVQFFSHSAPLAKNRTYPRHQEVTLRERPSVRKRNSESCFNTNGSVPFREDNKSNKARNVIHSWPLQARFSKRETWLGNQLQETKILNIDSREALRIFEGQCRQFEEWAEKHEDFLSEFGIRSNFHISTRNLEVLRDKEEKKHTDIVVIGTTSSGKSQLANKLIDDDVMLSAPGITTPCCAVIQKTSETRPYHVSEDGDGRVYFDYNEEDGWQPFQSKVDKLSDSTTYGCIRLFIPDKLIKPQSLIAGDVVLTDSPGLDRSIFPTNDRQRKMVTDADALILTIDMTNGLDNERTRGLLYESKFFVRPNMLVVFTKCDVIAEQNPKRVDQLIKANIKEVTTFMTREGGPYATEDEAKEAIFFISALEASSDDLSLESCDPSSSGRFPGLRFDVTEGRFSTDAASRREGFRLFYKSLIALSTHQRESAKEERMRNAISQKTKELFDTAKTVEFDVYQVEAKMKGLTSGAGGSDVDNYKKLVKHFYLTELPDGATEVSGAEKVEKFLNFFTSTGMSVIRSFLLPEDESLDERMSEFVDKKLKSSLEAVVKSHKESFIKNFSESLNPLEHLYSEFWNDIGELEKQMNDLQSQCHQDCERRMKEVSDRVEECRRRFDMQAAEREKELERLLKETKLKWSDILENAICGIKKLLSIICLPYRAKCAPKLRDREVLKKEYEKKKEFHESCKTLKEGELQALSRRLTKEAETINEEKKLETDEKEFELKIMIDDLRKKATDDIEWQRKTQRTQHLETFVIVFTELVANLYGDLCSRLNHKREEIKAFRLELKQLIKDSSQSYIASST